MRVLIIPIAFIAITFLTVNIYCIQFPLIIDIYYEVLCPYCATLISNQFNAYYTNGQLKLAIINFHPAGFVKKQYNRTTQLYDYKCHHEENECYGNQISNCLIDILGRIQSYKHIICLETNSKQFDHDFEQTMQHCLKDNEHLSNLVFTCMKSGDGIRLMHKEIEKNPSGMEYVPWIEVNGRHSKEMEDNLRKDMLGFICNYNRIECKSSMKPNKLNALIYKDK